MSAPFRTVAIFGKPRAESVRERLRETLLAIADLVRGAGQAPLFDAITCEVAGIDAAGHTLAELGQRADVAVVLGGDGTMLGIARELAPYGVPLIGINFGRLGFITDIALDQIPTVLAAMLAGRYESDRRGLLDASVRRGAEQVFAACVLNDVVVARGVAGGMVEFSVRVDGVGIYNQRGDGIIVATPTGSTAYALSANGPILHPALPGLVLVPVAPQTLSNRPIALPDSAVVEIEVADVREAAAHFDMQTFSRLAPGDVVHVQRSAAVATLLHPVGYNYFATLRSKLHWNVMPAEGHDR
ncbi:MAG: NAD kinase [Burkholderiales bacterium]|jgi:NAD+ kinase|nr:NAD kinase [Burkholderiales bacterium]